MWMTATARAHSFGGDSCGVVCRVMSKPKTLLDAAQSALDVAQSARRMRVEYMRSRDLIGHSAKDAAGC